MALTDCAPLSEEHSEDVGRAVLVSTAVPQAEADEEPEDAADTLETPDTLVIAEKLADAQLVAL